VRPPVWSGRGRRHGRPKNPYLDEAVAALRKQAVSETDPERRRCLEQVLAEHEATGAAYEADGSIDSLLWDVE
jgi:hypothetical protein